MAENKTEETADNAENKKEIHKEDSLASEEEKVEKLHLKTKQIPAIVMLSAGSIAAISTYVQHVQVMRSLVIIFVTLLVFWFLGEVTKSILDLIEYDPPLDENSDDENQGSEELENIESEEGEKDDKTTTDEA